MKNSRKAIAAFACLFGIFAASFVVHGVISTNGLNVVPVVQAQDGDRSGSRRCSARTLKGAYGIKFEGRKVDGTPIASVSRVTFDGTGQFVTHETGRFNGNLIQRTFTGPYTVNDDCTGFLDFSSNLTNPPHEAHGDFVIVNEGQEFFVVDNEDEWAATGVGERL